MQLQKSESQHTEFKKTWQDEYLKWICAFANTDGGVLYVGVDDSGEVCGVGNSKRLCEDIPNKILHAMGLICAVNLYEDHGNDYLQIVVEKYPFPVSYHGKYYKRSGSTTQEVTGLELDRMILAVQGRTWDSVPVPYVKAEDLDRDSIKLFKRMALDHNRLDRESLEVSDEVLMRNLRLYENEYLTKAAVMCFHPDPEQFVTCAYIKIGFFADNDADILYQDEIHGSLIMQVEKTMDLIYTKYMKALISYEGIHRKETFFFPKEAFRELLLNAVIHRDYLKPTPIQIRVYAHNIRIWNYGKMPEDVPVESLFKPHPSAPRNPNIANVFFKAGYVESWGRGYKNITDICQFRNAKLPEPQENSGGLMVECPASDKYLKLANELKVDRVNDRVNDKVNETQQRIISAISDKPTITQSELAQMIGISIVHINKNMQKLQKAGIIKRVGPDNGGHWEVLGQ